MAKLNIKEFAMTAVVPAVVINAAGYVEPKVDNFMNTNTTLAPFFSSNSAVNKNAKNAKYMKSGLYTAIGLVAQAAQMMYGSKKTAVIADSAALFAYGLSGATLAEDPVYNVPQPQNQTITSGYVAPARQVVVRTANVIS